LHAWRERFAAAVADGRVAAAFGTRFLRTWTLYLAFSEAAFAERTLANHQLLLSA
jgi:cyclopropane fatty-acyl-phospholipid synthase-like methyltransferase